MTIEERRKQVADQYRAVAHMAQTLADVHRELASTFENPASDRILENCGRHSAYRMEVLGDMLNNMDAVEPEDAWMTPIFQAAQRLYSKAK